MTGASTGSQQPLSVSRELATQEEAAQSDEPTTRRLPRRASSTPAATHPNNILSDDTKFREVGPPEFNMIYKIEDKINRNLKKTKG